MPLLGIHHRPALVKRLAIQRCAPSKPVRSSDAWCGQRSGIKDEPEGRGGGGGSRGANIVRLSRIVLLL